MTRVLIADGHQQFRSALRRILERDAEFIVVGEASSTLETLDLTDRLEADVVVMDVGLPGRGGVETTRMLKRRHRDVGVVLLSVLDSVAGDDLEHLDNTGHVLKGVPADEIVAAIKRQREPMPVGAPQPQAG